MPVPQLIALILALGIGELRGQDYIVDGSVPTRVAYLVASLAGLALAALVAGQILARYVKTAFPDAMQRRVLVWSTKAFEGLGLGLFAWWLFGLEWPRIVSWNLELRKLFLADELVVLLPFFVGQATIWVGLFPAERRLRSLQRSYTLSRHLLLRGRQTLGVMLPLVLIYGLGRDGVRWLMPKAADDPLTELVGLAVVAALILLLAPAFVRMSWPTRPLQPGPLRQRLERLADRFNFRCSNILVWDTGGAVVNAGITGALPWFRYVLLTDALLERLDPIEIEAVFGHEVGHVAHRHLAYFGFFFLGSIGVLALFDVGLRWGGAYTLQWASRMGQPRATEVLGWVAALGVLGLYFLLVFGYLSRRFERQADVFGCRAVSCGRDDCPPHADLNAASYNAPPPEMLCTAGIQIFANALTEVAVLNGLAFHAPSWRHGSIARRVEFLRGLMQRPDAVRRFQVRVAWMRVMLGVALTAATALAIWFNRG